MTTFQAGCCPPILAPVPHVHGITNEELSQGRDMLGFVRNLALTVVEDDSSSDDELQRSADRQTRTYRHTDADMDMQTMLQISCLEVSWNYFLV